MTSNVNYISINENFPVAGQDNDTQVFRDNFGTIKTSLRYAKEELTALQDNTAGLELQATSNSGGSDFRKRVIYNAVLQNTRDQKFDGGQITTALTIDYENGSYQIFRFGVNSNVDFLNFPGDVVFTDESSPIGVGKVRLELYGDGTARTITFITTSGTVLKRNSGFPVPFVLTSATNPVIIDVWRHSTDKIFMHFVGQFS